ncbi:hypothetical protein C7M84_024987 [Penaeus vannamei]|uniref:Uncharacterized protein n=1 Tax=Penaeus vannamei TaxID=6689 RepID=A0A423TZJ0_PENVA|nr:hypothetical protein C7M84_024987 [Penaeus vannamei]
MKKEIGALEDKIKAIEEEHKAELRNVAENQQEKEAEILRMQNEIVGLKETVASRDEKIKSLEERRQEERRGRETQAAGENKEQVVSASVLHDTIKLLQEQSTKELLSLRNAQHLKEAEAASQLREAQEALKSRDKRVKTLKEILLILHPVSGKEEVATQPWP